MKSKIKHLFLLALSSMMLSGCGSNQQTENDSKTDTNLQDDKEILKKNQHTPSDKIDIVLDDVTHECKKIEVACGTHPDCWPYRCVDTSQFVNNIEITKPATTSSAGSGVNHVTFNSLEIGRTYRKDKTFTIPKLESKSTYNTSVKEVSIENEVITGYLECDDLTSQYEYLSNTDKGVGSRPAKDYQEYTISWQAAPNREDYKIHISEDPDFSNYISDDVTGTSYNYGFYVPGKTYYVRVIGDDYENPIYTESFKVKDNQLRYVNVEGAQNMRDLGGWKTYDGKTVNYELLYRGANFNGSVIHTDVGTDIANGCGSGKLTERGKEQMNELGFQTEIDLRSPLSEEAYNTMKTLGTGRPSGEGDDGGQWMFGAGWNNNLDNFLQADMNGLMYEHLVSDSFMSYYSSIIQKVFDRLARRENYPVYFHCNAGADRTGTYAFMLNGLLGVQYNELTKDYQLTSYSNGGGRRWRNKGNGERFYSITEIDESIGALKPGWQFDSYNTWDLLVRRMLTRYGYESYIAKLGTPEEGNILQVCIEKWLLEEGVSKQQIDAFKDIMLNADVYEDIKDKEFKVKLNNVEGKSEITVHGGDTLPKIDTERKGYVLMGFIDEEGNDYNLYQRITKDMELTAVYKAYCDDLGQDSLDIIEWTTKKAKECIKNNPDYQYDGCSAAFAEGVAQFMPRNEACLDTSVEMPLLNYAEYGYVSFFVTSAWVTARLYIDDYYLGEVTGTSVAAAKKFNISITGSNVYVNGDYAYRLTSAQNSGLKPIKLRYVMPTYSKNADLCVSNFTTRVVDYISMAKSYAETLDNVVLGGFNTAKTLINLANSFSKYYAFCNDFEKTLVNASEKVLGIVQNIKDSVYTVTYRIWGEVSSTETLLKEDILKEPAIRPEHKPFTFAYWGTSSGAYENFNNALTQDITLDAYYEYVSGVDGTKKYAKKIYTLSYYCFKDYTSYYGDEELTKSPANPALPEGYTFLRWTANMDSMEAFDFGATIDDDTTLYAVARDASGQEMIFKNIYQVTFKDANGIGSDEVVNVFEEQCVDALPAPTHGDDEFAYWALNGKEYDFSTPIMSDITLVPYYWQESSTITQHNYTVLEMGSQMNALAKANPQDTTGWVANSGNGQYMAVMTSDCIEFGMRVDGKSVYSLNLPKFNFSQYKLVTFDVKNTWTATSFKVNGHSISSSAIGVNTAFKVAIKGNQLSVIVAGVEKVLDSNLSNDIVNGNESLVIEATDSTNGKGGGSFDIYSFLAYRNPVEIN